jgi:hypothetical protein
MQFLSSISRNTLSAVLQERHFGRGMTVTEYEINYWQHLITFETNIYKEIGTLIKLDIRNHGPFTSRY